MLILIYHPLLFSVDFYKLSAYGCLHFVSVLYAISFSLKKKKKRRVEFSEELCRNQLQIHTHRYPKR